MSKLKAFQVLMLAMIALSVVFFFFGTINTQNAGAQSTGAQNIGKGTTDLLLIRSSVALKQNEMPAVGFLHDLHTKAVDGDCAACHVEKDQKLVFKFKGTTETPSMDSYHENCISCHLEKKQANKAFGPDDAQCRACHTGPMPELPSFKKLKFSRSLHFIHESAEAVKGLTAHEETNCSRCHHKHNEKTKETFYIKGEEDTCTYCHKQVRQDDIRPIRQASHDSCVACHQNLKGQKIKTGPVNCEGCHDIEIQNRMQKKFKAVKDVPRLKRNQPDLVALTGWDKDNKKDDKKDKPFMNAVPFNHKVHETATDTCKTCHHNSIKKCNDCHGTDGGKLKGEFIGLEVAMHKPDSSRSCIGCHSKTVKANDCSGCHFIMKAGKADTESCKTCHSLVPNDLKNSDSYDRTLLLETALSERTQNYKPVPDDRIPEIVNIDVLANEYKASRFPHRKVVKAIIQRAEQSEMAKAFHVDQAGLCMGCHHNSPKSLEPPRCASCHSKAGPRLNGQDGRPGLKGAYHGQCISCHKQMKVEAVAATDCAKCHEKRK